jgi:hypothetical protein
MKERKCCSFCGKKLVFKTLFDGSSFVLEFLRTYATEYEGLLMIAFKAETENTLIKKSQELEDARWLNLSSPLPMHQNPQQLM